MSGSFLELSGPNDQSPLLGFFQSAQNQAKSEPEFRFYLLYDKVWRADILEHAYRLCRSNGGAVGVDGVTFAHIEAAEAGLEGWQRELAAELREEVDH